MIASHIYIIHCLTEKQKFDRIRDFLRFDRNVFWENIWHIVIWCLICLSAASRLFAVFYKQF